MFKVRVMQPKSPTERRKQAPAQFTFGDRVMRLLVTTDEMTKAEATRGLPQAAIRFQSYLQVWGPKVYVPRHDTPQMVRPSQLQLCPLYAILQPPSDLIGAAKMCKQAR
jgi:hypothetical protein